MIMPNGQISLLKDGHVVEIVGFDPESGMYSGLTVQDDLKTLEPMGTKLVFHECDISIDLGDRTNVRIG